MNWRFQKISMTRFGLVAYDERAVSRCRDF